MFTLPKVSLIMLVTMKCDSDMLVLALTTLGGTTEIGSFLFVVAPSKVAKASTVVTVGQIFVRLSRVDVIESFTDKVCQCKQSTKQ